MNTRRRTFAGVLWGAVLVTGCATPAAGDRFYVLDGSLPAGEAPAAEPRFEGTLGVGPVHLPQALDRPQIVTRVDTHRLVLGEAHRWAADLDEQVTRVMSLQLGELLGGARVLRYPWDPSLVPERQLLVDVLRLDAGPGDRARLVAQWALMAPRETSPLDTGEVRLEERLEAGDYEAVVAAVDRLVARLSLAVAAALRERGPAGAGTSGAD